MKKIAVLGGGVSGVVAARHLAEKENVAVDLIEKEERLGGLHRSLCHDGLNFDIGAFLFYRDHQLLLSFPALLDCFVPTDGISISITPGGNTCIYPLTVKSYWRENGLARLLLTAPDLLVSRVRHRRRDTVPSFAKYYMGGQIYRRSGLKNYIERLYGMKDEEVSLEFALQRLIDVQLYTPTVVARRILGGMFRRKAETPLELYAMVRPPEGFDEVYRLINSTLTELGVSVNLGCNVKSVTPKHGGFEIDFGDRQEWYDRVVSTIPIPAMLRLLGIAPQAEFQYTSLVSMFYTGKMRHDASWLYNFTERGRWKRITVFSTFYGAASGSGDYFTVEVTTQDTSPEHLEMLRLDFETHAAALGLCEPDASPKFLDSFITERAYPLFRRGKTEELQAERDRLSAAGIDFVGRQGEFVYISSDTAAQQAAQLAAKIN